MNEAWTLLKGNPQQITPYPAIDRLAHQQGHKVDQMVTDEPAFFMREGVPLTAKQRREAAEHAKKRMDRTMKVREEDEEDRAMRRFRGPSMHGNYGPEDPAIPSSVMHAQDMAHANEPRSPSMRLVDAHGREDSDQFNYLDVPPIGSYPFYAKDNERF